MLPEPRRRADARRLPPALVLGALAFQACAPDGADPAPEGAPSVQSTAPAATSATTPFAARFADATHSAGIDFTHHTGGSGSKRLPETMGSGACLFDYDGDGALDLFLVDSTRFSDGATASAGRCALYRGRGDGTFEDVGAPTGADVELYGMGVAAADYDADGDVDLFVTSLGSDACLRNDAGRFHDVAAEIGLKKRTWRDASGREHPEWTTAALWLDADGDLDLDLFVGGYCEWTSETDIFTSLDGVEKAFTTPDRYPGLPCRLYANRGDGTFEERPFETPDATSAGERSLGKVLGLTTWDFDGDGAPEIVAANDTRPNFLFHNEGGGRFVERAALAGIAYDENGRARAGMGIDVASLGEGRVAVAIGNFAGEPLSLYGLESPGRFASVASRARLQAPTTAALTFGLAFLDVDLDGWLDLVVVNGHIEPDIARYRPGQTHAQSALLFRGLPDGTFEDVTHAAGPDFAAPRVGRGLAWGDVDGDGDLDLVVTQNGGSAVLLENLVQQTSPRHYLRVLLRERGANRSGLGAVIELRAGGRVQVRAVRTGSSYLSQGELAATFGLGALDRVEELVVRWPDGRESRHAVDGVDRTLVLDAP